MHAKNSELSSNDIEIPDTDICICAGDVSGIVEERPPRDLPFRLAGNWNARPSTAKDLIERHIESRAFIASELEDEFDGRTVVFTHHAPLPRSLHPAFRGHPSNAAFASDLSAVIDQGKPDLWVHGHIHHFRDYEKGTTRVICNPRGYE